MEQVAKEGPVNRLKDYRNCFTHYTPVDTMLVVTLRRYADGWEFRAKLPVNPNVREILGFRFSRRLELLRYALSVYRNVVAFDQAVAQTIANKEVKPRAVGLPTNHCAVGTFK